MKVVITTTEPEGSARATLFDRETATEVDLTRDSAVAILILAHKERFGLDVVAFCSQPPAPEIFREDGPGKRIIVAGKLDETCRAWFVGEPDAAEQGPELGPYSAFASLARKHPSRFLLRAIVDVDPAPSLVSGGGHFVDADELPT